MQGTCLIYLIVLFHVHVIIAVFLRVHLVFALGLLLLALRALAPLVAIDAFFTLAIKPVLEADLFDARSSPRVGRRSL